MTCRFGNGCQFAHGVEELQEWKRRFVDKQKIDKQKENESLPPSISERINSKNMMVWHVFCCNVLCPFFILYAIIHVGITITSLSQSVFHFFEMALF